MFICLGKSVMLQKKKNRGMMLSAMLIYKGMKKGYETILSAVVKLKLDV